LHPEVRVALEALGSGARSRIQRRLVAFARDLVSELFAPLRSARLAELSPAGRGLCYQLEQQLGTVLAHDASAQLESLGDRDRALLRSAGVELGRYAVYLRSLLRAPQIKARAALSTAYFGPSFAPPPRGAVSIPAAAGVPKNVYLALGYVLLGPRAVRADVAERVARAVLQPGAERADLGRIASWLGCARAEAARVLEALGLGRAARPRPRRRGRPRRRVSAGREV
jgi:ATP-dependent RNA helicase SUPV3L1/SUV3